MSESLQHMRLVSALHQYLINESLINRATKIYIDLPDEIGAEKPPLINGHRPDLFADNRTTGPNIIGEAKTVNDIEKPRSFSQYEAYIKYCHKHPNNLLIIAVRWDMVRLVNNIIKNLAAKHNANRARYKILDRLTA